MARIIEHPCEGCGCTESRACPGGCSWDTDFLEQGRYVCNRCAPAVARKEGQERTNG